MIQGISLLLHISDDDLWNLSPLTILQGANISDILRQDILGSNLEDTGDSKWNTDSEESEESTSDEDNELEEEIRRVTDTGCCPQSCCQTRENYFIIFIMIKSRIFKQNYQ